MPQEGDVAMKNHIIRFVRDERGEDLIEYGLLAAFVAAVATAVIIADPLGIKGSLKNAFNRAKTALDAS
jgi:Flp pilus assembly pilin Flp